MLFKRLFHSCSEPQFGHCIPTIPVTTSVVISHNFSVCSKCLSPSWFGEWSVCAVDIFGTNRLGKNGENTVVVAFAQFRIFNVSCFQTSAAAQHISCAGCFPDNNSILITQCTLVYTPSHTFGIIYVSIQSAHNTHIRMINDLSLHRTIHTQMHVN